MTTTNLTSDEREPTITTGGESLSIFEIMQRYRNDGSCEHVIEDALRRLSLIDNHALECNAADWAIEHVQSEYLRGSSDAATRMRDKCVTEVRAQVGGYCSTSDGSAAKAEILAALESLTLDQVEQETK